MAHHPSYDDKKKLFGYEDKKYFVPVYGTVAGNLVYIQVVERRQGDHVADPLRETI